MAGWGVFKGDNEARTWDASAVYKAPPWRLFGAARASMRGTTFRVSDEARELVNAAFVLRRPLLVTGKPGTGKSSLAWAVAHELGLGTVLEWPINTRSTLQEGLYRYDAIARLQDASLQGTGKDDAARPAPEIGKYVTLGALGTALLPAGKPRVLLVDEIDKSDLDLPNDLLNVFEEGGFKIPELSRLSPQGEHVPIHVNTADDGKAEITGGEVQCTTFPFVLLTSNAEREFPPAFLRRCLRLTMPNPTKDDLTAIIKKHFVFDDTQDSAAKWEQVQAIIDAFWKQAQQEGDLSTDQLLNAVHIVLQGVNPLDSDHTHLREALFRVLTPRRSGSGLP